MATAPSDLAQQHTMLGQEAALYRQREREIAQRHLAGAGFGLVDILSVLDPKDTKLEMPLTSAQEYPPPYERSRIYVVKGVGEVFAVSVTERMQWGGGIGGRYRLAAHGKMTVLGEIAENDVPKSTGNLGLVMADELSRKTGPVDSQRAEALLALLQPAFTAMQLEMMNA